jgi:hypothetical protein
MSLTKATYSMVVGAPVNVLDYGAIGDGVVDDTAAIQAAIDAAQVQGRRLYAPAGRYKITQQLTVISSTGSLTLEGDGRGSFDGSTYQYAGTTFELYTPNINAFSIGNSGRISHSFSNFAVVNMSGGSNEVGIYLNGSHHCYFSDITVSGFNYLIRGQRTVWCSFDRIFGANCTYGISLVNITGTPPLVLNQTNANGFYNNVISVRDSKIIYSEVAYEFAGCCISLDNIDASVFTTAALRIGGTDYNVNQFRIGTMYIEAGSLNPISITNATGTIDSLFVGQNCTNAVSIINSRLVIGTLQSYAAVTNGISNSGGRAWLGLFAGTVSNAKVDTNNGLTWVQQTQQPKSGNTSTITFGTNVTLADDMVASNLYKLTMFIDDNGTGKFAEYLIRNTKVTQFTTGDTVSFLSVTSILNGGTGRYDIRVSNTAGFAYNIAVTRFTLAPVGVLT